MKRAVTLLEILVVVVILGILAALILPRFMEAGEKQANLDHIQNVTSIKTSTEFDQLSLEDKKLWVKINVSPACADAQAEDMVQLADSRLFSFVSAGPEGVVLSTASPVNKSLGGKEIQMTPEQMMGAKFFRRTSEEWTKFALELTEQRTKELEISDPGKTGS